MTTGAAASGMVTSNVITARWHTAKDHGGLQRQVAAVGLHAVVDLGGQFTGRRNNQGP